MSSKSGAVSGCEKNGWSGAGAGVTEIGLRGEQKSCVSCSAPLRSVPFTCSVRNRSPVTRPSVYCNFQHGNMSCGKFQTDFFKLQD